MSKATGEMKESSQRVGISLTSIQKAVNMSKKTKMVAYSVKKRKAYNEESACEGESG